MRPAGETTTTRRGIRIEPGTKRVRLYLYKGQAEYWSVRARDGVHDDLAWSYRAPFAASQKIAGLIAFYNEKVDIYVDGERQDRPVTKFS
jgi:uncharacterized protein (DUF427 family)